MRRRIRAAAPAPARNRPWLRRACLAPLTHCPGCCMQGHSKHCAKAPVISAPRRDHARPADRRRHPENAGRQCSPDRPTVLRCKPPRPPTGALPDDSAGQCLVSAGRRRRDPRRRHPASVVAPESSTPGRRHSPGVGVEDPVVVVPQKLDIALRSHRAGRLSEAEAAYSEVLSVDPENIDALHFLGVVAYQRNEHGRAEELISRALSRNASNAPAYSNLGNALGAQGKLDAAMVCYERALALQPEYADAWVNLGVAFRAKGELDKAVQCYQRALSRAPDVPMAHFNLGNALAQQGKLDEAAACLRKALALKPDYAEAFCSLGNVLRNQDRLDEAIPCYRKAISLKPDFPEAYDHLSNTLIGLGRPQEAEESYRRALALRPDSAELKLGYSLVKLLLGDYETGFLLYESRLDEDALPQATYSALQARIGQFRDIPRWQGESGERKTLLVWTDQGLGDALMTMR